MTWLFLILAVLMAFVAFSGSLTGTVATIGAVLFWIFVIIFLASLFRRTTRRRASATHGSSDVPRGSR